ncbi:hypothetical protein BDW59DRAFT_106957 [Aspergillus cavernicola]|uniref:BZIP domain-containing protein n=1 Tax=Aspergillus cavernicola TaxID=176166 RepID=A0ABR4I5D7_9EURO
MSADPLPCPIDFSGHQDEWLDFDSLFQLPSEYLESNSTSVESISPRDLDQSFTDTDFLNWGSDPAVYSQSLFPETVGYEAPMEGFGQPALDSLQPFINPNDVLQSVPQLSQDRFIESGFDSSSFRYMVESQAALDNRYFSKKEKLRDASIALHLQRLQNAPLPDSNTHPPSNQFSSPDWSVTPLELSPRERSCPTPATSFVSDSTQKSSSPTSESEPGPASMQFVLDLNMNTATNAPRKQKPRSKAQRDNYIKARKYGVCEKHRKQHKRCNCLEKAAAAHLNVNASCAGANTIGGLRTNHERALVHTSTLRSVQSPTRSANTGLQSPLARQPIRAPNPDLSPTLLQSTVSPTGHDRVTTQNTHPLVTSNGSLRIPSLYRDKKSQNMQRTTLGHGDEHPRQVLRQSVDFQGPGSRTTLTVQRQEATTTPLAEHVKVTACKSAGRLFSFWQSSTTLLGKLFPRPFCRLLFRNLYSF